MALRDFWTSVKTAAGLISPTATVDSPSLDAKRIEGILRRADMWLASAVVKGFDERDFDFLDPHERAALSQSVATFRRVADQVPQKGPATSRQVHDAASQFRQILTILQPDKYGDEESFRIGKLLERQLRGRLPPWVHGFRIDTGRDVGGDPAVWIWVEVEDEVLEPHAVPQDTAAVREMLIEAVRELGVERWPFVRFRTVSEQQALAGSHRQ